MNKLLTTKETCEILGMKSYHLNRLYSDGFLDKIRINMKGKKPSYLWLGLTILEYMKKNPKIYGEIIEEIN